MLSKIKKSITLITFNIIRTFMIWDFIRNAFREIIKKSEIVNLFKLTNFEKCEIFAGVVADPTYV